MTPQEKLEALLEARTRKGGGPSVPIDAGGNPIFTIRKTISPQALAILAQVSMEESK